MIGLSLISDKIRNSIVVSVNKGVFDLHAESFFDDLVAFYNSGIDKTAVVVFNGHLINDPLVGAADDRNGLAAVFQGFGDIVADIILALGFRGGLIVNACRGRRGLTVVGFI